MHVLGSNSAFTSSYGQSLPFQTLIAGSVSNSQGHLVQSFNRGSGTRQLEVMWNIEGHGLNFAFVEAAYVYSLLGSPVFPTAVIPVSGPQQRVPDP